MIEIYTKGHCPFCKQVKETLNNLALTFKEYEITNDERLTAEMEQRSQRKTVPQVFINDNHIGGGVDFHEALDNGQLDELIALQRTQ